MLIKIPDADDAFVEKLKRYTGTSTGSKAYAKAAAEYNFLMKTVEWQKGEIARLEQLLAVRDQTIQGAREAAIRLLEATGQGDLFDGSVPKRSAGGHLQDPAADGSGTNPLPGESSRDFLARIKRS